MNILVSLLPVLVFLFALNFFDSYRLVKPRSVVISLVVGIAAAGVGFMLNRFLIDTLALNERT